MFEKELSQEKSEASAGSEGRGKSLRGWIKVGAVAAASAVAGGLAAAWFYRKTLKTFREAESDPENSKSGIPGSETEYDL